MQNFTTWNEKTSQESCMTGWNYMHKIKVYVRLSDWNKSSEFTLLTFTTFVPRPKKVKKFFQNFSDTILIPLGC